MRAQRPPLPLIVGFTGFLAVIAFILAASLLRPKMAEFPPTPAGVRPPGTTGVDTVTIDARDPARWRFFSLDRGILEEPDTADWDLAFRRFHVIVSGAAADAGSVDFHQPIALPDSAFAATTFARDTLNAALARWYRYGFISHLLRPNGHIYLVRTRQGALVKLEVLGYYCPGSQPGCFTLRWMRATP